MKNSIYDQSNPKDNMLLAALKKAVANSKATNSLTGQTGNIANAKQTNPVIPAPVNQSKLDQVERRLNQADRAYTSITKQVSKGSIPPSRERQTNEDDGYEERKNQEKALEAFERKLRHSLFGEPLAKKPVPLEKGVYALDDSQSAPLRPGGPLAKNGARTRGYTDTASDIGAPIRFMSGTDEDKKRKYHEAISRGVEANQEFHDYLVDAHIDIFNATPEQKDVIDMVGKELMKKSVLGTLTQEEKSRVFDNTLRFLYSHTKSANGDPYPVYIDIISNDYTRQMMPELGSMQTEGLSESDMDAIFDYGKQSSRDKEQNEIYAQQRAYKNDIFLEEVENYNDALRKGTAEIGGFQEYYDRAMKKIYDTCVKPIPVKDKKGKVVGSVAIGELIDPNDDSLKAQAAMNALEMLGTAYEVMDCEGLVKWAYSQVDPMLGKYGVGNNAQYQRNRTSKNVFWPTPKNSGDLIIDELQTGDLLYWENELGETVCTAIYLGGGYMIESSGTVRVTPLRMHTSYGDGSGSDLVQVNRPTEDMLYENVEKNTKNH